MHHTSLIPRTYRRVLSRKCGILSLLLAVASCALAQGTPPPATPPAPPSGEFAPGVTEQDASATPVLKPKPFTVKADEVTATSFVHVEKNGARVIHKITDKTEVLQGRKEATFAEIKAGDMVTGTRRYVSETEYELVKVTKFVKPAK